VGVKIDFGQGARSGFAAAVLAIASPAAVFAQTADGLGDDQPSPAAIGRDDLANLEMNLLVEPPPDLPPYVKLPPVEPEKVPPPPPKDLWGKWQALKTDLHKKTGTSFNAYLSFSPQYVVTGPNDGHHRGVFWFNLNINQDLWKDAMIISNVRGGSGRGLGPVLGNILPTNWMQNETDDIYISHLFFQQALFDKKLTLSIGKLDLDDIFDTNEVGSWNFLSYAPARNPGIPVPWHVLAGVAHWEVNDLLYVQAGAGDRNGEGGETGFDTTFGGDPEFFAIGEIGVRPKFGGKKGTYRLMVWYDPHDLPRFDGSGNDSGDWGVAFNFDQQINDKLGIFARYGYADGDVRALEHFWSAGFTYAGAIPGRNLDVMGVGVAQGRLSGDLRRVVPLESAETLFEAYYRFRINDWASITPDVQVILDPGARSGEDTAFVAGVNLVLMF
jgi:carbohydrate-selective porin OprB